MILFKGTVDNSFSLFEGERVEGDSFNLFSTFFSVVEDKRVGDDSFNFFSTFFSVIEDKRVEDDSEFTLSIGSFGMTLSGLRELSLICKGKGFSWLLCSLPMPFSKAKRWYSNG